MRALVMAGLAVLVLSGAAVAETKPDACLVTLYNYPAEAPRRAEKATPASASLHAPQKKSAAAGARLSRRASAVRR